MYQGLFNFLIYCQRYASDKHFIAKNKTVCHSVNTGDRVTIVSFSSFPDGPLSVYLFSLNYLEYI